MSRYTIAAQSPRYEVIVGWDPPMQTLFGQVFVTTAEEDDEACVLWVGLEVQALTTVAALQGAAQQLAAVLRWSDGTRGRAVDTDHSAVLHDA